MISVERARECFVPVGPLSSLQFPMRVIGSPSLGNGKE